MSRKSARENAFFLLFQMDFYETEEYEKVKEIFFAEKEQPLKEEDRVFITKEAEGAQKHKEEIDKIIQECAKGWEPERMNKVDLAILRLAMKCAFRAIRRLAWQSMRQWNWQRNSARTKPLRLLTVSLARRQEERHDCAKGFYGWAD